MESLIYSGTMSILSTDRLTFFDRGTNGVADSVSFGATDLSFLGDIVGVVCFSVGVGFVFKKEYHFWKTFASLHSPPWEDESVRSLVSFCCCGCSFSGSDSALEATTFDSSSKELFWFN